MIILQDTVYIMYTYDIASLKGSTACQEYVRPIEVSRIYLCPSETLAMDVATTTSVMVFAQKSLLKSQQGVYYCHTSVGPRPTSGTP